MTCGVIGFTGKERDAETSLDYFGARYFSGAQGRFTSPDPVTATPLDIINPQRWNQYAYAVNNPLAFVDPDGRDAVAVNFSKLAGGMGHSAITSVHRDGSATLGEYGPRGGGKLFYTGQYTTRALNTKIAFGSDGLPTKESFAALTTELAGAENQPSTSISLAYYKTADWETAALDAYIQAAALREQQGKTPFYAVGFNDCRNFCLTGLRTARVEPGHYVNANISPNWIMRLLAAQADASYSGSSGEKKTRQPSKHPRPKVDSKICFAGQPGCPAGQEQR